MIVDPLKPIVVPSVGHDYSFTLEGKNLFIFLPVLNWGTEYTSASGRNFNNIGGSVEKLDSLVENYVLFRNIKTGNLTNSPRSVGHYVSNENGLAFLSIPREFEAGEYEMTVVRRDRRAIVPDKLKLTYGVPRSHEFYSTEVFNDKGNIISYKGYNLVPGHTYEVELENDYFPKQRFPLIPVTHLTMTGHLPLELATGTYKANLLINGKAETYTNLITRYNLVTIHKQQQQPALTVLTQPSLKFNNPTGLTLYEQTTLLKRSEPVLALYKAHSSNFIPGVRTNGSRLLFKNINTGAEFSIPQTGFSSGSLPYLLYTIPAEMPAGKYQVRFGVRYSPEGNEYISGLYYQEIKIE